MSYAADASTEPAQENGCCGRCDCQVYFVRMRLVRLTHAYETMLQQRRQRRRRQTGVNEGAEGDAYGIVELCPTVSLAPGALVASATRRRPRPSRGERRPALSTAHASRLKINLGASGERIAKHRRATTETGGATADDFSLVFVNEMPSGGCWTWINVADEAGRRCQVRNGVNAGAGIGAYAAVETAQGGRAGQGDRGCARGAAETFVGYHQKGGRLGAWNCSGRGTAWSSAV